MLKINEMMNNKDNEVIVNGDKFMVTDDQVKMIAKIILGQSLSAEPTVKEEVKTSTKSAETAYNPGNVKCKWAVEEIDTDDGKFYRIVDGIFTYGVWRPSQFNANEEYRIPCNQEAHKIALNYLKKIDGIKSVKTPGGWYAYGFASKSTAESTLEKLPERIQGVEINAYIAEHGAIKAQSVKRPKKS